MNSKNNQIPEYVSYREIIISDIEGVGAQSFSEQQRDDIVLQAQGVPALIDEAKYSIAQLLQIAGLCQKFSPELALKTKEQKFYLIFDHQAVPVIRDRQIIDVFVKEIARLKNEQQIPKEYVSRFELNLGQIMAQIKESDETSQTVRLLETVLIHTPPCQVVVLSGEGPALRYLLALQALDGIAAEVWYQTKEQKAIQIR